MRQGRYSTLFFTFTLQSTPYLEQTKIGELFPDQVGQERGGAFPALFSRLLLLLTLLDPGRGHSVETHSITDEKDHILGPGGGGCPLAVGGQ